MSDPLGARMPKACRTCAKAKVRCEPEANGVCKRCRRLEKECSGQAPGAHRRQKPTRGSLEVSALEAKLDRMVEMLAASERSRDAQSNISPSPGLSSRHPNEDNSLPKGQDDDIFMAILRRSILPLFPFIVIPPNLTAEQLRREHPFLHLNISMVACQTGPRQREIAETVKQWVAEHIVLGGQHSMDILQGLLVFVSWFITVSKIPRWEQSEPCTSQIQDAVGPSFHAQFSAQLDVFMQLAMAQVISLNLNQGISSLRSLDRPLSYLRATDFQPNQIPARTLEERRIYLGCYYVSVMLSVCVRDMEPVRFTKYTQECCEALQEASEFATDAYLVQLVRVMHLADKVHHTMSTSLQETPPVLATPLALIVRGHQAELQQLKASVPCEFPHSALLSCHYQTVEILIYRVSLSEDFSESKYGDYTATRLDLLFRCLEAVKSFFYDIQSIPSELLPFFPFTIWCQFGVAMVTLSRLTLFQGEKIGWDRAYVQSTIDVDQTAESIIRKIHDANTLALQRVDNHEAFSKSPEVFDRIASRMELFKAVHRKRLEAQEKANPQAPLEPPDFSFMLNIPVDALFPYGHYGEIPSVFDPTNLAPRYY